jgi:tetratricopeptide (TPR) repeat protein
MRKWLLLTAPCLLFFPGTSSAQTTVIHGKVIGEDGQPLQGALIRIERTDIRGNYKVNTKKKGEYFHAGLPLGMYKVSVEVEGKVRDTVGNVQARLDPTEINFDLAKLAQEREALAKAAQAGKLTAEQKRRLGAEARANIEKQMKERQVTIAKDKALNDVFNAGVAALQTKQFEAAIESFVKAGEMDPKQHIIWGQLAESYVGLASSKSGAEQEAILAKAFESFEKAMELKPEEAAYRNNYALALARAKRFAEAEAELAKAAEIDPANAGRYFYNLGAVLVNIGQLEPAGQAFKRAIETDSNYADAQYQYGVYLISKAETTADGRVKPIPGTREAFEAYLKLEPEGKFADSARGMIAIMEQTVETEYTNPEAKKKKKRRR